MKKAILLSILIVFISCSKTENNFEKLEFDQNTFEKSRKLWKEQKSSNYTFSQVYSEQSTGYREETTTCTVKKNVLNTVLPLNSSPRFKTIDEVYGDIERMVKSCKESIDDKDKPMVGATIKIEYDAEFHYPTKIKYSGFYPEGWMGGLSSNIFIKNFKLN